MRLLDGHLEPRHERMHDSRAERGRQTVPVDGFALLLGVVRQIDDRRFESREGEIQRRILDVRIRQLVHLRIAVLRQLVDLRTARIADTEHAGDFIERLACCVVACAAEDFKLGVAFHHHDLAVTAGRDQCQKRRFQLRIRQISSRNVSSDVVHRNERLVHRKGERLAEVRADEQRTDQSGRTGRGNRVHIVLVHFRILKRLLGHAHDRLHVPPRRDFRHNAAVQRVRGDLRVHHARQDFSSVLDDGCRRFIARGLDCKYFHG